MGDSFPTTLGRYEIQGVLGRGAMGVVYKARDPLIGRELAIKTFRTAYLGDDVEAREFRVRFLREAQSAGILNHPNIVTIHDVVEESEEGITFIAMEYVEGTNLKEVLRRGEPLELSRVTRIVSEVADALDYAHGRGVIHRDVKPANILLTEEGQVKLTDFGIARLDTSDLTQEGQLLGTPNYMAPERILGREVDWRTDIFSLGVVLYEMLTREKPFRGDNLTMVTHQIVYEPFAPLEELEPELPPGVIGVLDGAMAKKPGDRYESAGEMASELLVAARLAEESGYTVPASSELSRGDDPGSATQDVSDRLGEIGVPPSVDRSPPAGVGEETLVAEGLPPPPGSEKAAGDSGSPSADGEGDREVGRAGVRDRPWLKLLLAGSLVALLVAGLGFVLWGSGEPPSGTAVGGAESPADEAAREGAEPPSPETFLDAAREAMEAGSIGKADRYVRQGLVLDPDHPGLRSLGDELGATLTEQELAAEKEGQVAAWVAEARSELEEGELDAAETSLERALMLEPEHEEALTVQEELTEARREAAAERRARVEPAPPVPSPTQEESQPADSSRPEPRYLELTVDFQTEVSEGTLTLYVDDSQILREPFDFRKRVGLFKMEESAGRIEASFRLERGETTFRIYVAPKGKPPAVQTLEQTLQGGTSPTLKIVFRKDGRLTAALER